MSPRKAAWRWLAALLLAVTFGAAAGPAPGETMPSYRIATLAGPALTPAALCGRVLVLNFWATWCAPCRQELPVLDAFQRKYAGQGVDVVAVSVDERGDLDAVRRVLAPFSFAGALAVDSDLRAFGRVRQVPATFVVDRHGVLRRNGWDEAGIVDADALDRAVRPLLRSGG